MRRAKREGRLLITISLWYAVAAAAVGFGSGFLMRGAAGPHIGEASVLPLHALGFHGIQAVPLVAILLYWGCEPQASARTWTHSAGAAWVSATLAVGWQTLNGLPLPRPSPAIALAVLFLAAYLVVLGRALIGNSSRAAVPAAG